MKLDAETMDVVTMCAAIHNIPATVVAGYVVWAETPPEDRDGYRAAHDWMMGQIGEDKLAIFKNEVIDALQIGRQMMQGDRA